MTNETDTERAEVQAKAQLDNIKAMVKRLDHAESYPGGEIEDSSCPITEEEYTDLDCDWGSYHNDDAAREAIEEDALSVEVRDDWHSPGSEADPKEYNILLCTGGPAVRIRGELGMMSQPESAILEYQDWFTPWTEYPATAGDEQTLLAYARVFWYGE